LASPLLADVMSEPKPTPILLIEDDRDVQAAMRNLLEANGYTVLTASDGREGLLYLRCGVRPAVILLDLWMPVMDGATFRIEQSRDAALRTIPVVVLSGEAAVGRSVVFDGVPQYRKPLDAEELLRIVAQYASARPATPPRASSADVEIEIREKASRISRGRRLLRGRRSPR
jgi:CheY-like chemotaxis protein